MSFDLTLKSESLIKTQETFTCSIETLEKGVNHVQSEQ